MGVKRRAGRGPSGLRRCCKLHGIVSGKGGTRGSTGRAHRVACRRRPWLPTRDRGARRRGNFRWRTSDGYVSDAPWRGGDGFCRAAASAAVSRNRRHSRWRRAVARRSRGRWSNHVDGRCCDRFTDGDGPRRLTGIRYGGDGGLPAAIAARKPAPRDNLRCAGIGGQVSGGCSETALGRRGRRPRERRRTRRLQLGRRRSGAIVGGRCVLSQRRRRIEHRLGAGSRHRRWRACGGRRSRVNGRSGALRCSGSNGDVTRRARQTPVEIRRFSCAGGACCRASDTRCCRLKWLRTIGSAAGGRQGRTWQIGRRFRAWRACRRTRW